jgi:hypothetical protein
MVRTGRGAHCPVGPWQREWEWVVSVWVGTIRRWLGTSPCTVARIVALWRGLPVYSSESGWLGVGASLVPTRSG